MICNQLALPLIIVSNRGRAINKVIGLELGADDYMCKPIDLDELVARVHAVLRRTRRQRGPAFKAPVAIGGLPKYRFDGWELDSGRRTLASAQSGMLDLTSTEIDLLLIFVKNAQVPLSREHIVQQLGKSSDAAIGRAVDVLVSKLRRKLESDGVEIIKTVRGAGYVFTASVVAA